MNISKDGVPKTRPAEIDGLEIRIGEDDPVQRLIAVIVEGVIFVAVIGGGEEGAGAHGQRGGQGERQADGGSQCCAE